MAERDGVKRKSYEQACTVAAALDVVGDRWTMLILRELLGGPARFRELEQGLPGIAKNLLTTRLRRLEGDGLVRRLRAPVRYALTERGAATRGIIEALGTWGARGPRVAPSRHERSARAVAVALQAILSRPGAALPSQRIVVELEVGGEPLELVLGPRPAATVRAATEADARLRVSGETISAYLAGRGLVPQNVEHVSGDEDATATLLRALGAS